MRNQARNSIVYRLRNAGYRIDTKNRLIYKADRGLRRSVQRLIDDFGYIETEELFESNIGQRIYIATPPADASIAERFRNNGYIVIPRSWNSEEALKNIIKAKMVFFGNRWYTCGGLWLMETAIELGKDIYVENEIKLDGEQ